MRIVHVHHRLREEVHAENHYGSARERPERIYISVDALLQRVILGGIQLYFPKALPVELRDYRLTLLWAKRELNCEPPTLGCGEEGCKAHGNKEPHVWLECRIDPADHFLRK